MREIFVTDLVKELLGPRNGVYEVLDSTRRPITEYITGILSPRCDQQKETIQENKNSGEVSSIESKSYEADHAENASTQSFLNPTLNPEKIPSSMGLSFQVSADSSPKLDVCITWARYIEDSEGRWKRSPRYSILSIDKIGENCQHVNRSGKKCEENGAEIQFVSRVNTLNDGKNYFISLFMINVNQIPDAKKTSQYYIYQPQIRVLCADGTKIMPMREAADAGSHEESTFSEFAFRKRKFLARGHMTSAVWWSVDPENIENMNSGYGEEPAQEMNDIPFKWIDGEAIPKDRAGRFFKPEIRTEYIPLYSIPSPEIGWEDDEKPVLDANELADMWDPRKLEDALRPLQTQYDAWISNLDCAKDGTNDRLVDKIKSECNKVLSRISDGVENLVQDDDARLAFCFANKAIAMQHYWSRKNRMRYRPFQVAFVLMSLESILNHSSKFRDTCDLLWVSTGTGKTEAYLMLVAISMSYRRLKELKKSRSGAGVDVISRYTLRLLTIQQFRRSLSLFAAAEKLRVHGLHSRKSVGWRPAGFPDGRNLIWGSTPFSVGLWVGGGVTPNKLEDPGASKPGFRRIYGALTLLEKDPNKRGQGEPAQILKCPACENLLAIPDMGLTAGSSGHEINWIVKTKASQSDMNKILAEIMHPRFQNVGIFAHELNSEYKILSVKFTSNLRITTDNASELWNTIKENLENIGKTINLESTSPSRPGYFYKYYKSQRGTLKRYDFQIFCTRHRCPLNQEWVGGSPYGGINHSEPDPNSLVESSDGIFLNDKNKMMEIKPCFRKSVQSAYISSRIPINALTVDQQIYRTAPTMIISTVDKFARLPFEPQIGIFFGNIEFWHIIYGYYRNDSEHPSPKGKKLKFYRKLERNETPLPPSFIVQDELHLLEGPLGSMVGLYESCIDFLSKRGDRRIKYIASTATIQRGEDQVRSLFARNLQVFPPHGTHVDDRFFIREREIHPLVDNTGGRLYAGIMAPGKGALTPTVRIWSRLAQTGFENKADPEIDRFWTVTGYFNTVKELAGADALYDQDILTRIRDISSDPRPLPVDKKCELSGRTHSNNLPEILDILGREYPDAADGLLTTSMFGTGIDIPRIGAMLVIGQPKTTSAYIQSTGRVGRSKGGIVLVFFRATRPRDLSHYEYFVRNHRQLHRTVESPTVSPLSSGSIERSLGPVIVGMLRNMRNTKGQWHRKESAMLNDEHGKQEIIKVKEFMEKRSQEQPEKRRTKPGVVERKVNDCMNEWEEVVKNASSIEYVEYDKTESSVILGDPIHERSKEVETVFPNSPQSLRELEEETGFGINQNLHAQSMRPSQFIIAYGPGAILELSDGPVIIPTPDRGLFNGGRFDPREYKIENARMSSFLSRLSDPNIKTEIFRLPTNAESSLPSTEAIYKTKPFPKWKLCLKANRHPDSTDILHYNDKCPVCGNESGNRNAIGFVRACRDGHLDDVDWNYIVHSKNQCANKKYYQWIRTGTALKDIEIKCPDCAFKANFGNAFYRNWSCSGRSPEKESLTQPPFRNSGCRKAAKIILKQAANIRLPDTKTFLSIKSVYTKLHGLVQNETISATITTAKCLLNEISEENFEKVIDIMKGNNRIPNDAVREFENASWDEIREAVEFNDTPTPNNYHDMIIDEFRNLLRASKEGAPPPRHAGKSKPMFEVIRHDVKQFECGGRFIIAPVSTLETITVQTGFRREVSEDKDDDSNNSPRHVDVSFIDRAQTRWFPGASFIGEGIFISMDSEDWVNNLRGDAVRKWILGYKIKNEYSDFVFRDPEASKDELHPGFVWWHTLSHLLIRAISQEAGYSVASIRERIDFDIKGEKPRGGILLYATQPGTEGTFGGLTDLVSNFDIFLKRALDMSKTCSADPICSQQRFRCEDRSTCGACCYGCLMNSETSCEHRNLWLDRIVLRDNVQ